METTHQLTKIYQQLQRALTEVTNLQIQVMDMKDQLSLMSHQVGEMCWAIDWIIELQPLVEQFEGVDTARHVTGRHVDPLEQRLLQPVGQGLAYFRIAVT